MIEQHSLTEDYENLWKFTGHELDKQTGLYYAGARYYNPKWSIWMSVDPLAEAMPSWSSYAYTFNNPIRFIDPTGMNAENPDGGGGWFRRAVSTVRGWFGGNKSSSDPATDPINSGATTGPLEIVGVEEPNNIETGSFISGLSFAGSVGTDVFEATIPNLNKSDFLIGRVDPSNVTNFRNGVPNAAMGNIYESGYRQSINSINNLQRGIRYLGAASNVAAYYETGASVVDGNYARTTGQGLHATFSVGSNYVPIVGPILYEGSFWIFSNTLPRSEWYNRIIHGRNSEVYRKRGFKYGFTRSRTQKMFEKGFFDK